MGVKLRKTKGLTFWTMTLWKDPASMTAFRNNGAHLNVMPRLKFWCDEASFAHWEEDLTRLPSWEEAAAKLIRLGHLSKVNYPSPEQMRGKISTS